MTFREPTLRLTRKQYDEVVAHCLDGLPDEACGLFAGPVDEAGVAAGAVEIVYPTANADESARSYTVDSRDLMKAMRDAEDRGLGLVGVFHSHTHTDAYPSQTDVRQAAYPEWLYALVSLRHAEPVLRAYRIVDDDIAEVAVEVT